MVNQTLKLQYERDRASYLEALAGYMKQISIAGFESDSIPMMFSTFDDRGGYGGIMCTGALLKRAFLSRMKAQEDYLQASFQGRLDSGKSIDQTFKLSKVHCRRADNQRILFETIFKCILLNRFCFNDFIAACQC